MLNVIWEFDDGNSQDSVECSSLSEALDKLAFYAREYEGRLNWIQIEFNR